jgi:hypothetical protein
LGKQELGQVFRVPPDQGTDLQAVLGQIEANRDRIQAAIEGDPGPQASNGDQATSFKIPPN